VHDGATGRPLVGVGVIVRREGRVLLGQRLASHGAGSWALPGGHLEFGESVADCARREVREETGLALESVVHGPFVSNVFEAEGRHYVTLFVLARAAAGEARACEPHKCAAWHWFRWSALPQPLFAPLQALVAGGYEPASD
jgi:8-oxo-dGTP diphosphatase